jgi:TatD DNase family protein
MSPPPLDLHAHVDPTIDAAKLTALGAVIFAASRSLDESEQALARQDLNVVWGAGCHPAKADAQRDFDAGRFATLAGRTAFVSEVGLDGGASVSMTTQRETLSSIFRTLQDAPRITSLHTYKASDEVLDCLEKTPIRGAVLHWWLGGPEQTARAIELGCFFSVNASSVRHTALLDTLPLDRILTETDHPFGDRRHGSRARPGLVADVERTLAVHHRLDSVDELRGLMWDNLGTLVRESGCGALLPRPIRLQLMAR